MNMVKLLQKLWSLVNVRIKYFLHEILIYLSILIEILELPTILLQNQVPKGMKKSEALTQMEAAIKKYTSEIHLTEDDLYEPEKKQPPRYSLIPIIIHLTLFLTLFCFLKIILITDLLLKLKINSH